MPGKWPNKDSCKRTRAPFSASLFGTDSKITLLRQARDCQKLLDSDLGRVRLSGALFLSIAGHLEPTTLRQSCERKRNVV